MVPGLGSAIAILGSSKRLGLPTKLLLNWGTLEPFGQRAAIAIWTKNNNVVAGLTS